MVVYLTKYRVFGVNHSFRVSSLQLLITALVDLVDNSVVFTHTDGRDSLVEKLTESATLPGDLLSLDTWTNECVMRRSQVDSSSVERVFTQFTELARVMDDSTRSDWALYSITIT
jgi:hypothetical protein